jgi:hypothetical protein
VIFSRKIGLSPIQSMNHSGNFALISFSFFYAFDNNINENSLPVNAPVYLINILISMMHKTRVEFQGRSSWVYRKHAGCATGKSELKPSKGFWIQKHASFAPARQKMLGFRLRSPLLWRGTVPAPPSNGFFHPKAFAKSG